MAVNDIFTRLRDARELTNTDADTFIQYAIQDGRAVPVARLIGSTLAGASYVIVSNDTDQPGTLELGRFVSLDEGVQRMGVGTQSPLERLHVAGALRIDNDQDALGRALVLGRVVPAGSLGNLSGYLKVADAAGAVYGVPVYDLGAGGGVTPRTEGFGAEFRWTLAGASVVNPADTFERTSYTSGQGLWEGEQPSTSGQYWHSIATDGTGAQWRCGAYVATLEGSDHYAKVYRTDLAFNANYLEGQTADGVIECTFPVIPQDYHGLMVRLGTTGGDAWKAYLFMSQTNGYSFRTWNFDANAWVNSGAVEWLIAKVPANGDTVEITLTGDTFGVRVKPAGGSYTDYGTQAMTALNTAAICHGLMHSDSAGSATVRYDNYSFTPAA